MDINYKKYYRDTDYQNFEGLFRNIFKKRFLLISRFIGNRKGRVLDIGCSTGIFLQFFKETGWESWGVEPSASGKIAEKKGVKLIKLNFEKAKLPKNYFDLVILNHTLEHMDNPAGVLKKVKSVLKKGGIVFVDVPNFGGLSSRLLGKHWPYLLPKEHKWQFTKESLKRVFEKTNLKVLHWESRSGIFEYANPHLDLWQSLIAFKKRFLINIITFPYSLLATVLNMGDSMSMIGERIK